MATHTTVLVTACDRNGHLLDQIRVTRQTEGQCREDRAVAFAMLRERFPDAQVYFNWNYESREPLTRALAKPTRFARAA